MSANSYTCLWNEFWIFERLRVRFVLSQMNLMKISWSFHDSFTLWIILMVLSLLLNKAIIDSSRAQQDASFKRLNQGSCRFSSEGLRWSSLAQGEWIYTFFMSFLKIFMKSACMWNRDFCARKIIWDWPKFPFLLFFVPSHYRRRSTQIPLKRSRVKLIPKLV